MSMNLVSMPEMQQLLTNTAQITSLAERVTRVAEEYIYKLLAARFSSANRPNQTKGSL
jgi:hypothetical protein